MNTPHVLVSSHAPAGALLAWCSRSLLVAAAAACTQFKDDPSVTTRRTFPEAGLACDPTKPFGSVEPVPGLVDPTAIAVAGVRLSPDLLSACYAADSRPDSIGGFDLYVATRDDRGAPFGDVMPLPGARINSYKNELDPTVSGDGLTLAFGTSEANLTLSSIEVATRPLPSVPFTGVGPAIDAGDGGAAVNATPFLREDGQVLYFSSAAPAAGNDIYRAGRSGAQFGPPEAVDGVNSYYSEVYPVVTPDDLTMYFASDRPGAQGEYGIWVATRDAQTQPFSVRRTVSELNSGTSDMPSFVTADGCTLYFTSSRNGYLGVYQATKPAQ